MEHDTYRRSIQSPVLKGSMQTLSDVVDVLSELSEKYELELQELRSTVSQLTTENRRLRKSTDNSSDESTTAATMSSTPDPNSKKKAKFAVEEERSEDEFGKKLSSVSDPYLNSEVLPEISDLELEARRRVALGQSMSPVNRSDTPTEGFLLMHFWRDEGMRKSRSDRKSLAVPPPSSMSTSMPMRLRPTMKGAALGITELYQGTVSRFIARPGNRKRLLWDLCGLCFIIYDCWAIPLNVFDPPEGPFSLVANWLTLIYWTLNVGATLTTGFVREGQEVLSPKEILKNYLKTWFLIDVLTLGPDWTLEIMAYATAASGTSSDGSVGTSGSESMRLLRVFRVVRVARLLRLLKVKWLLETIGDAIPMSDYTSIVARVAQMMAILLYLNHVIACVFFATTTLGSYKTSWTDRYVEPGSDWRDAYMVALHWSLTQFTPAAMDVQPQNPLERAYTISVVIFALVGFSYVVGDISSCLTQLRNMSETSSKEFRKLRNFMRMHNVPRQLALRVTKFAEHAYSKQREAMPMSKVTLLNLVSEQLLGELAFEMNKPFLIIHPLFENMEAYATILLQRLCTKALVTKQLAHNDFLFVSGKQAEAMYFLSSGQLLYKKSMSEEDKEYVQANLDWVTEPALWLSNWEHLGTAEALGESVLISINAETFKKVVAHSNPAYIRVIQIYARRFLVWINEVPLHELSDVFQKELIEPQIRSFVPDGMLLGRSPSADLSH